jgi:hypothetical protein
MKQKVQSDLLDTAQTKITRFDLSGELRDDSAVMHTYGHDESYNRASQGRRRRRNNVSNDFLQPGFGGFSYHEGVTPPKISETSKSRMKSGSRTRSKHSRSKHASAQRDNSAILEWSSKTRNRRD